jgi:hypothetical protein
MSPMPVDPGKLLAPLGIYLGTADLLRFTTYNSAAGVTIGVIGRMLNADGEIVPFTESQTPLTTRAIKQTTFNPGDGWLLELDVYALAGTPKIGQCYVVVEVVQGQTGAIVPIGHVWSGYVTATGRVGYPRSPAIGSTEGPGFLRSVAGTDPAAGVECSETVPAGARWRLISLVVALVTDATVANRIPVLTIDDGTTVIARGVVAAVQAASLTVQHAFSGVGAAGAAASATNHGFLPSPLVLSAGYRIKTVTGGFQAGDNYGPPNYLVEEWIEP